MIFGTKNRILHLNEPTQFSMTGIKIKFVNTHNYLGITLDCTMNLNPLLKNVNKKITNKNFNLRKIRKNITRDAAVLIYKQTILPLIDYSGFLLIACTKEHKDNVHILRICCE